MNLRHLLCGVHYRGEGRRPARGLAGSTYKGLNVGSEGKEIIKDDTHIHLRNWHLVTKMGNWGRDWDVTNTESILAIVLNIYIQSHEVGIITIILIYR